MLLKERLKERGRRRGVGQSFHLHSVVQAMKDQMKQITVYFHYPEHIMVIIESPLFSLTCQHRHKLPCSRTVEYKQQDSYSQTHWDQRFGQDD